MTRDRIIDAALLVIDSGGVEALSMPKLAARLGVEVMSLYSHIDSKDLLDAVARGAATTRR